MGVKVAMNCYALAATPATTDVPITTPGVAEDVNTASVTVSSVVVASEADSGFSTLGSSAGFTTGVSAGGEALAFFRFFKRPKRYCQDTVRLNK